MANYLMNKIRKDPKKRETMIVFVYDTECCQNEADDPVDAVLYFHPSWVSDTQKLSLCGQLMGTTHFLKECFFKPKIISLQNGKFVLKEFGRFILAVGTDRNLSDSLLENRAELLTSLLKFYHRDIQTIYDQFSSLTSNGQYKNLSDKLYHIFETYLPILQYNGNIFQNIPKLRLPKSASNIFLDAIQTLQSCQQTKGVLGGTILYHNKVVATQLSAEITKNLILTDPFHIKSTAEPIIVDFYVPIGVQLLIVYISNNEYKKLLLNSQKAQSVITQSFSYHLASTVTSSSSSSSSLPLTAAIISNGPSSSSSSSTGSQLPPPSFQFQIKRKMKRDKSLIFTNIPEEGQNESVTVTINKNETTNNIDTIDPIITSSSSICNTVTGAATAATTTATATTSTESITNQKTSNKTGNICRPNHLPLKFKNMTSKEIPESGFVSINFDESDSYPEFIGRTSVCSTPMTENKILQYDNIMSICSNPIQDNIMCSNKNKNKNNNCNNDKNGCNDNNENHTKNNNKFFSKKFNNNLFKIDFDNFFTNFINNPHKKFERRNSFTDIQDSIKRFSKRLTVATTTTKTTTKTAAAATEKEKETEIETSVPVSESLKQSQNLERNCRKNKQNENDDEDGDYDDNDNSVASDFGGGTNTSDFVDDISDQITENGDDCDGNGSGGKSLKKKKIFRTITDPLFPVFNSDGEPISKSLFQEFLDKYYKTWNNDEKKFIQNINGNDDNDNEDADDIDSEKLTKLIEEFKDFDNELNKNDKIAKYKNNNGCSEVNGDSITTAKTAGNNDENSDNMQMVKINTNQTQNRKSLSLPIKPLNELSSSTDKENQTNGCAGASGSGVVNLNYTTNGNGNGGGGGSGGHGIFERKKHTGIQLTPLMAKLSILALNEERSSGFCSWDTTPGIELPTPITDANSNSKIQFRRKSSINRGGADDFNENNENLAENQFKRVELYICGQQNMTLLLLLEEGSSQKQNLVQAMFDTCVSKLTRIETQLNQTLNINVDGDKNEGGYSYIYVDPKWDTLQRGGPWSIMDLDSLEHMHRDLNVKQPITDLILRNDDSVLYGYKCGGHTEYFYKQPTHSKSGLPPPADIMGTISMKAKRRLERDHSLILF